MKKIITYESFNQEEFATEEECRAYEEKYARKVKSFIECYSYYDATMVEIIPPDTDDIGESLNWIENSYSDSEYVRVKKIPSREIISFTENYLGIYLPDECGLYKYDDDNGWQLRERL